MRLFLFFLLFCALAHAFENKISLPILEVSGQTITTPAMNLRRGESGFVLHQLDSTHSMMLARAVVVAIEDSRATLALRPLELFENRSMPLPLLAPKVGDQVVLRAFYNRAFAIAPNQQIYRAITAQYPNIEWLHPDLFAAFLANQGRAAPTMEHFREICNAYATGVVYLVRENIGELRDCQTFALLRQDAISSNEEQIKPFFSRLGNMERSWIGFLRRDPQVIDYYRYYNEIVHEFARANRDIADVIEQK